jgi:hypothetical protein
MSAFEDEVFWTPAFLRKVFEAKDYVYIQDANDYAQALFYE